MDQVAESRRTRRVKEGIGDFASVSTAFGTTGPIHLGNPGLNANETLRARVPLYGYACIFILCYAVAGC